MNQASLAPGSRPVVAGGPAPSPRRPAVHPPQPSSCRTAPLSPARPAALLGAASSALLNALKKLAGIDQEDDLVSARAIEPIQTLKIELSGQPEPPPAHR